MDPTTQQLWMVSLLAAVVVVLVVAVVLELIVVTAHQINELVQQIWYGGARIAQNTVTLALLRGTNNLAGKILGSASEIAKEASRIRQRTSAPCLSGLHLPPVSPPFCFLLSSQSTCGVSSNSSNRSVAHRSAGWPRSASVCGRSRRKRHRLPLRLQLSTAASP